MKTQLYLSLLSLSLLAACRPNDSITPEAPDHSPERRNPFAKTCPLTSLTQSGTIQRFAFTYDPAGRMTRYDATGVTPRFTYGSHYTYNNAGFLVKETFVISPFLDSQTTTNVFEYDSRGKLIPAASLNQTLERDAAGRVVKLTKRNTGNAVVYVVTFAYNALGRKIQQQVAYPDGRRLTWKWDVLGENLLRSEKHNAQGLVSSAVFTYDRNPNPLKTLFDFKGWEHTDYINLKGWHPFDTYEDFGGIYGGMYQPIERSSTNNPLTEVRTAGNGAVTTISYAYEYNANGQPTSVRVRNETTGTTENRTLGYLNCQ